MPFDVGWSVERSDSRLKAAARRLDVRLFKAAVERSPREVQKECASLINGGVWCVWNEGRERALNAHVRAGSAR
jgi:hypothetical protein